MNFRTIVAAVALMLAPGWVGAEGIGLVKVVSGEVVIERGDERIPATVGMPIFQADRIVTGRDGSIGVTLADNAMLSAGPESVLELTTFRFDPGTHAGQLDVSLKSGTLSAIAGKMVEANPEAMKVRTPAAVLGVRGTEFAVRVEESGPTRFWKALTGRSRRPASDGAATAAVPVVPAAGTPE